MSGHSDVTLTLQRQQLELREGAAGTADAASPAARCLFSGCLSLPRALQDQDPQRGQARPEGPVSSWGLWALRVGEFPCPSLLSSAPSRRRAGRVAAESTEVFYVPQPQGRVLGPGTPGPSLSLL